MVEAFTCAVCTEIAFAPPNQQCGHVHCRSCLAQVSTIAAVRAAAPLCPPCRKPFSAAILQELNGFVQNQIFQMHVKCPRSELGCEWTGSLGTDHRNLREHHSACGFHQMHCEACNGDVLRSEVPEHPQQCSARPEHCVDCRRIMKHSEYVVHRTARAAAGAEAVAPCTGSALCRNGCLSARGTTVVLPLARVAAHEFECPQRLVKCDDCMESVLARSMISHRYKHCSHRNIQCDHCSQSMPFYLLATHRSTAPVKDGQRASCVNMRICANDGCSIEHHKDAVTQHAAECSHRLVSCPCCAPPASVPLTTLPQHIKERLIIPAEHSAIAQRFVLILQTNEQVRQEAAVSKTEAATASARAEALERECAQLKFASKESAAAGSGPRSLSVVQPSLSDGSPLSFVFPNVCNAVRQQLSQSRKSAAAVQGCPVSIVSLRAQFFDCLAEQGVHGSSATERAWEEVEQTLNKDPRIARSKCLFQGVSRQSWTWMGPSFVKA